MEYKSTNRYLMAEGNARERVVLTTSFSHFDTTVLACKRYEHALIQPYRVLRNETQNGGGVVDSQGRFVPNTGYHFNAHQAYSYSEEDVEYFEEDVLYIGCIYEGWGHLFTDGFAKLWYLGTEECQQFLSKGGRVVYITLNNRPLQSHTCELFKLANVDLTQFSHITNHTRFRFVSVPDDSFALQLQPKVCRIFTREYSNLIVQIRQKFEGHVGQYPEKIYFTRTRLGQRRRDYGELSVERLFRKAGYNVFSPEQLSVKRQIDLLSHCKSFAATEGSVSMMAIFCRPRTQVIVVKKTSHAYLYQAAVNDVTSLSVTYVEAYDDRYCSKKEPWQGPFFIYPTHYLKEALGLFGASDVKWLNKEWYRYLKDYNPMIRRIITFVYPLFFWCKSLGK